MQVGKGAGETGPAIDFSEQTGDAKARHQSVEAIGEGFGRLRGRRFERRDLQLITFDPDVFQLVGRGFGVDFGEAPLQPGASLGEILFGHCRRRNGKRSGLAHRCEQRGGDKLVFDGAPLPAAFDPDVASAQPITQRQQGGRFPNPPLGTIRTQHGFAPSRPEKAGRQAARPFSAAAFINRAQYLDCP